MTISSKVSSATLNGNGITTAFPFNFVVWDDTQLAVHVTGTDGTTAKISNWTVERTGTGGVVTYPAVGGTVLPTGASITILRDMPVTQEVDLVTGVAFNPEVVETALDQIVASVQQVKEAVDRSVSIPVGSPTSPTDYLTKVGGDKAAAEAASAAAQAAQIAAETAKNGAEVAAASAAAVANTADGLVKVSVGDASARILSSKLVAGNGLSGGIENPGGDEALRLSVALSDSSGLGFAGGLLRVECGAGLARTATGLAADAGTGPGQLVQLDGSGKLASSVIPSDVGGTDQTARDNAALNAFLVRLSAGLPSGAVPRGVLNTLLSDELPLKTGATYNAAGDYYTNASQVNGVQPTSANAITGGYTRIDKTLAIPVNTTVRSLGMYSTVATSGRLQIVRLDAAGTYTALAEVVFSHTGTGWEYFSLATPYTTAASGTFYIATYQPSNTTVSSRTGISSETRLGLLTIGASTSGFADGSPTLIPSGAYEVSPTNMDLVSSPVSLGYVPTKATVYILHKAVDAVTLNTDVKVRVSRGAAWTFATDLTVLCQYDSDYRLLRATVDVSGQTSGSNGYWGVMTYNNKAQRVRAALLWAE